MKDGTRLWNCPCRECCNAPVDVLVAGGLVWTGDIVAGKDPGFTAGRDPRTGAVQRTRPRDQEFFTTGMVHQRCYRNKATNDYLVIGRAGVEFIDVHTGQPVPNHWVRGTCQYGVMPCNGLLYAPSNACACFIAAKLNSFNCLTSQSERGERAPMVGERLERGPAYQVSSVKFEVVGCARHTSSLGPGEENGVRCTPYRLPTSDCSLPTSQDWPTYRHDAARSGRASAAVPFGPRARLDAVDRRPAQQRGRGGGQASRRPDRYPYDSRPGQPDGPAAVDVHRRRSHRLAADRLAGTGPVRQRRRLGLLPADGGWGSRLALRAAPYERRIVAYGQLESLWPVSGSVLVRDGVVYCAAGRSSYLDGGMRLCRLEAKTGALLSETPLDDRDPQTGFQKKDVVQGTNMPGALPDILSCDDSSVYMRHRRFDLAGQPQPGNVDHLFSAAGFLDGTWWHRTYWLIGTTMGTNYAGWPNMGNRLPSGRLLVVDGDTVYGFGLNQYAHTGAHVGIDAETIFNYQPNQDADHRFTYYHAFAMEKRRRNVDLKPVKQYQWSVRLPVLARALVLAGDTLFFAGPPDIFTSDDPTGAWEGTKAVPSWPSRPARAKPWPDMIWPVHRSSTAWRRRMAGSI